MPSKKSWSASPSWGMQRTKTKPSLCAWHPAPSILTTSSFYTKEQMLRKVNNFSQSALVGSDK